jgi:hypothetical protein
MFSVAIGILNRASEIASIEKTKNAELVKIVVYALHTLRFLAEDQFAHSVDDTSDGDAKKTASNLPLDMGSSGLPNDYVSFSCWISAVRMITDTFLTLKTAAHFDDLAQAAFDLLLALFHHVHHHQNQ